MADKQPMQADGAESAKKVPESDREPANHKGESQGGAYPNGQSGKKKPGFTGGQTVQGYHGGGQLGEKKVGDKPNAGTRDE